MLQTNIAKGVPAQLKNIGSIRSIELRGQLITIVSTMLDILQETQDVEPDEKTTRLVQRFHDYLVKSCQSPSMINRRAPWLSTYGNVVLSRVISFRNRNIVFGQESMGYEHEEFLESIIKLVTILGEFQSEDSDIILETLQMVMKTAEQTKPNQRLSYYSTISTATDRMITFYTSLYEAGKRSLDKSESSCLIRSLVEFNKKLKYYNDSHRRVN